MRFLGVPLLEQLLLSVLLLSNLCVIRLLSLHKASDLLVLLFDLLLEIIKVLLALCQ